SARLRRQDLVVTWRLALLMPGAMPLRSIVLLVTSALWAVVSVLIVPLAVLVGAAAALDLVIGLFARRIEDLLTQIDHARSAQTCCTRVPRSGRAPQRRRCRAGSASVDGGLAGLGVDRDLLGVVAGADVELVLGPAVVVLELPAADRPVHLLGRDPAGFVVAH